MIIGFALPFPAYAGVFLTLTKGRGNGDTRYTKVLKTRGYYRPAESQDGSYTGKEKEPEKEKPVKDKKLTEKTVDIN